MRAEPIVAPRVPPTQLFGLAFCASVVLCLALEENHAFSLLGLVAALGATGVVLRLFADLPVPLTPCVLMAAFALVADPIGQRLLIDDVPAAVALQRTGVWSECLMLAIGGRLVGTAARRAFDQRWRFSSSGPAATAQHSAAAALLIAMAATLAILALVPARTPAADALSVAGLVRSALLGTTSIHVAILVAAMTALVLIVAAYGRYLWEIRAFAHLRGAVRRAPPAAAPPNAAWVEAHAGPFAGSTTAISLAEFLSPGSDATRLEAAGLFHDASRQFLRRLIGLLPLLGFLGTVVGLAAAISGLPRGLTGAVDLTASLGGLAIKFETTFLGLAAHLIGSLLVNLLDRLEWEARAGLMQFAAGVTHDGVR